MATIELSQFASVYSEKLNQLVREWDETERVIKTAEIATRVAIDPAIWELRYAGRRIIDSLVSFRSNEASEKAILFLDDAIFDCLRARHDAVDATTMFIANRLDLIFQNFEFQAIKDIYPDITSLSDAVLLVQERAISSRQDRENRDATYMTLAATDFKNCCDMYHEFDKQMIPLRNKEINRRILYVGIRSLYIIIPLTIFMIISLILLPNFTTAALTILGFLASLLGAVYGWLALSIQKPPNP